MSIKRFSLAICLLFILTFNFVSLTSIESKQYYNEGLKRAAATYVVVRGINSILSVAQETEISASPGGMGLTIAVGQFLDPLNDLIERFSVVILMATTSLGIQKLLLTLTATPAIRYLVLISVFCLYLLILCKNYIDRNTFNILSKIFLFTIVLRFVLPTISFTGHTISKYYIDDLITQKTNELQTAHDQIGQMNVSNEQSFYARAKQSLNFPEKIDEMEDLLSKSLDNIFDLITLFISQTIILPLAFLYLITIAIKHLFSYDFSIFINEQKKVKRLDKKQTVGNISS
ncbi:MAG: hypothetical protein OEM02_07145 [Desulfobulbaceae bacterium]|nr:hypothetical protein [Desulfobulbaceae bacterium]